MPARVNPWVSKGCCGASCFCKANKKRRIFKPDSVKCLLLQIVAVVGWGCLRMFPCGERRKPLAWDDFRYAAVRRLKGRVSHNKRPPFALRKTAFCNTLRLNVLCARHYFTLPTLTRYSAICTALRAAPLRIWSPESQKVRPLSSARSLRMRPT